MNLHEYQSKRRFAKYGIPVLPGDVASTPEEARQIAREIGGTVVVKAQVLVGGRGKAGGVKLAQNPDEAEERARQILGMSIKGHVVHKVLVDPAAQIANEIYLGITNDRQTGQAVMMSSSEGGAGFHMSLETMRLVGEGATVPTEKVASLRADQTVPSSTRDRTVTVPPRGTGEE